MGEQQRQAQAIVGATAKAVPTEPNALYEEIAHRLEHYNSLIEKLNTELKKLTLMRNVLAAAQDIFNEQQEPY